MVDHEEDLRPENQAKTHNNPISALGIRDTLPTHQQSRKNLQDFDHPPDQKSKKAKGRQALMENNHH